MTIIIYTNQIDLALYLHRQHVGQRRANAARERLAPYRAMGLHVMEVALKADPEGSRALLSPWLAGKKVWSAH